MGISKTETINEYAKLQEYYNTQFASAYSIKVDEVKTKEAEIWNQAYENAKTELGENAKEEEIYSKALENYSNTVVSGSEVTGDLVKISTIQESVLKYYNENVKESWLWVKNVWRPDTNASGFSNYATFATTTNFYDTENYKKVLNERLSGITDESEKSTITKNVQNEFRDKYNFVTYNLQQEYSSWNGYFILVILAAVVTYLSVTISQMQSSKKQKRNQEMENPANPGKAMKIMKFILPIIMIIFTIGYSAVFALYIVTNSIMATIISFVCLKIFEKQEKKQKVTITTKNRPDYSR